jgi:hypothetical protein
MWVKLDDTFPDHPKVEKAGPAAAWLYVCGLCYCARYLTDGLIPGTAVARLTALKNNRALAEKLVDVGLWERDGDDFRVHNYEERNPSKEQIEEKRRQTRERIADWRAKRKRNGVTPDACNAVTTSFGNAGSNAPCNASPVPSSPVLDPDLDPNVGVDMPDSPRGEPVPLALLPPEPPGFGPPDLLALWNDLAPVECPRARELSPSRRKHAAARLREHPDPDYWRAVIGRLNASSFARGDNDRGWRADFDWLLRPDSGAKTLEGKYDDRGAKPTARAETDLERRMREKYGHLEGGAA